MTSEHLRGDGPFFAEWSRRKPGERRDLGRAHAFGVALGTFPQVLPVLTVVGSKGKGTAAVHAAATFDSARRPGGEPVRAGLVTSPGLRHNRERGRLRGTAIGPAEYDALSRQTGDAIAALGPSPSGYLSPSGSFLVAMAGWLADSGVDALVLEEGLGGRSDEISLFAPHVVVLTPVFLEHVDLLGATVAEIARDLLGVVQAGTRHLVTTSQTPEVQEVLDEVAGAHDVEVHTVGQRDLTVVRTDLAPLVRYNAMLGEVAGRLLASELGFTIDDDRLAATLSGVQLPGRSSEHLVDGKLVMIDGAISAAGVEAAVHRYADRRGRLDTVVACFPDSKDAESCYDALAAFESVVPATSGTSHLTYETTARRFGSALPAEQALAAGLDKGGCLVVGTQSLVGDALTLFDIPTDVAYVPPGD